MNLKQYEGDVVSHDFGNRLGNFTVKGGDGPKDFFVDHQFFTWEGDQNLFPIEGSRVVVFYVMTGSRDNPMQAIGLNLSRSNEAQELRISRAVVAERFSNPDPKPLGAASSFQVPLGERKSLVYFASYNYPKNE